MKEVRNLIIGIEITKETSQIAYYDRQAQEPVSVPSRMGTNLYAFPTALARRKGGGEWYFGIDAVYFSERGEAVSVLDFFATVAENKAVDIDGERLTAADLLSVFLGLAMKLLGLSDPVSSTRAVCVTSGHMTGTFAVTVRDALLRLGFSSEKVCVEDDEESFYYYCYSQQPSIWTHDVGLVRFSGNYVRFQSLTEMKNQKPCLVSIHPRGTTMLPEEAVEKDKAFSLFLRKCIGRENFSAIFITGEGFSRDWARDSVLVLCGQGRRVFEGNNLFVKGAVWAALEKKEKKAMKTRVFYGTNLLRKGLCVDLFDRDKRMAYPLLEAGKSWFLESSSVEGILDGTKDIVFTIVSLEKGWHTSFTISLSGLPERPDRTTRIRIEAFCTGDSSGKVLVRDMGFGDLYPSSGLTWEREIYLGSGKEREDGRN